MLLRQGCPAIRRALIRLHASVDIRVHPCSEIGRPIGGSGDIGRSGGLVFLRPDLPLVDAPPGLLQRSAVFYRQKHLLAIEGLHPPEIGHLLDLADSYALLNRSGKTQRDLLRGRTLSNLFFEDSTRTRTSFELARKRLGADVINMSVSTSSVNKGETLLDTAATLNAMQCDLLVVRHGESGAPALLAQKVEGAVINAGDGTHEHPTQALLDALTIKRRKGRIAGLIVAICGDVLHSRVARSNIHLLTTMGSQVRVIGPPTLMPPEVAELGVTVFHDMKAGLEGADIVMMLRLQRERMVSGPVPSAREYFRFWGLDAEKLAYAKPDSLVMHPGPMNRGVEIDSSVADDPARSVIKEQVEMGVAVRMAVLDVLSRGQGRNAP
jgi:aspartate carbamoyltransferase catalytic subunit